MLGAFGCLTVTAKDLNTVSSSIDHPEDSVDYAEDSIRLPPARRTFKSPTGNYILVISNGDGWESVTAIGELIEVKSGKQVLLWRKSFPQRYGPRYAVVNSSGRVFLFDEWVNVKSPYALMLFDTDGRSIKHYGFEELQRELDIPIDQIVDRANFGWWIMTPPRLEESGNHAVVEVGGTTITIDLENGNITQ